LGADGQLPLLDAEPLDAWGFGVHLEGAARYAPTLDLFVTRGAPFVEVSLEGTFGLPPGDADPTSPRFRLPAPTTHGVLGTLDLARADNTASGALALGLTTPDGFCLALEGRLV